MVARGWLTITLGSTTMCCSLSPCGAKCWTICLSYGTSLKPIYWMKTANTVWGKIHFPQIFFFSLFIFLPSVFLFTVFCLICCLVILFFFAKINTIRDTGQGLNRVQSAPRIGKAMHTILHKVQTKVWPFTSCLQFLLKQISYLG